MLDFLIASGLTKTDISKRSGINRRTLYFYIRRRKRGGLPFRDKTVNKLRKAYEERLTEVLEDANVRKELGL